MAEPARTLSKGADPSDSLPTDALREVSQQLLGMLVQRAAQAATERVSGLSDRLTDVAENGGTGLGTVFGRSEGDDGDGAGRGGLLSRGLGTVTDAVKGAFGGGNGTGGQGKKVKVTSIIEDIDVGLPLRTTYDLWTQFGDFPSFMKKVESVEQESDEKTNWKAQVLWSHRTWEATIVEQVPDSHIVWRSKGAKGHTDGAISFTELGPNLTRLLLVLEYHPQGLFERTGNIWRAQGRRARLEFKHFRRHAMSTVLLNQDAVEGWRGEIHDSEVVTTHEEALEAEQRAQDEQEAPGEPEEGREEAAGEAGEAEDEGYEEPDRAEDVDEDYEDYEDEAEEAAEAAEPEQAEDVDEDYEDEDEEDEAEEADEAEDEGDEEAYEEAAEADAGVAEDETGDVAEEEADEAEDEAEDEQSAAGDGRRRRGRAPAGSRRGR